MTDNTNLEQQPNAQPSATGTAPGQQAGQQQPAERTFTQAEVNAFIQDRLSKHEASILSKLGVPSLDDAKKATAKLKEIEDAQKTDAEKTQQRLTDAERRSSELETQARKSQVENAAIKGLIGQVDPAKLAAALKLLDTSKLKIEEDGTVAGLTEAVKTLFDENPFLKPEQPQKPKPTPISATNPAGTSDAYDLSWYKGKNPTGNTFRGGGVRPPSGE